MAILISEVKLVKLLNFNIHILAYEPDAGQSLNPLRRIADWTRQFSNLSVSKPKSERVCIEPGQTESIFSGVRSTSIDGTTAFDITLLSNQTSTYRFSYSAGTDPGFRTERVLSTDATSEIDVSINNNATAVFTASGGTLADFSGVLVGDILRIYGVTTGDTDGPFNDLNEGYWQVIAATASTVTCVRLPGEGFSGAAESGIVLGASFASNFRIYSAAGVQIGDRVEISAGFSAVTQKTFTVSQVGPDFFEVVSSEALPLETGIVPGAAGMIFYTDSKRLVYLEADQEAVVRINGMSGNEIRLSPFIVGDEEKVATYQQTGVIYSLDVVNRSETNPLNLYFFFAE